MPITIDLKKYLYFHQGLKEGEIKGKISILKELGFNEKEIAKKLNLPIKKIKSLKE